MGQALNILLGWPVLACAAGVAAISAVYVTSGGQTSVIMTDLFQGMMLLATGAILLWLGIDYMGDFETFWSHLPAAIAQRSPTSTRTRATTASACSGRTAWPTPPCSCS